MEQLVEEGAVDIYQAEAMVATGPSADGKEDFGINGGPGASTVPSEVLLLCRFPSFVRKASQRSEGMGINAKEQATKAGKPTETTRHQPCDCSQNHLVDLVPVGEGIDIANRSRVATSCKVTTHSEIREIIGALDPQLKS